MRRTFSPIDKAFIGLAGHPVASWVVCYESLLVTRAFSTAHSLAAFRVGGTILPERLAEDLNTNNDAYPLARPSQAAAIASIEHEDKIRERSEMLRGWTREVASTLEQLGAKVAPSETCFFLADFSPRDADDIATRLAKRNILIELLGDPGLGRGYTRVTAALPEQNQRFVAAFSEVPGGGEDRPV